MTAEPPLSDEEAAILFDPQTAGGLVVSLGEAAAAVLASRLDEAGVPNWWIGEVADGSGLAVVR